MHNTICRLDKLGAQIVRVFTFRHPICFLIDVAVSLRVSADFKICSAGQIF